MEPDKCVGFATRKTSHCAEIDSPNGITILNLTVIVVSKTVAQIVMITSAAAAKKGHLVDTQGVPQEDGHQHLDASIQDITS